MAPTSTRTFYIKGLSLLGWKRELPGIEQRHTQANNPLERTALLESVLAFLQCRSV
jgi:hypothetical protein